MFRTLTHLSVLLLLAAAPALAQTAQAPANLVGEWSVYFSLDDGPEQHFTMDVAQNDTRIKGVISNERGEFPFYGTVSGKQAKISWTLPTGGQMLEISFSGTVEGPQGNRFVGRVTLGNLGEGPLEALLTSR